MISVNSRLREKIHSRLRNAPSRLSKYLKSFIRQPPTRLLFFLLFIFLCFVLTTTPISSPSITFTNHLKSPLYIKNHVTIWHSPKSCIAPFRTGPARESKTHFPYAVLRDAVVDRRPISTTELAGNDPPGTVRIVLYFTNHLSARLTTENSSLIVQGDRVSAHFEYVNHITTFLIPRIPGRPRGSYRPGLRTKFGREVTEWQAGLKLYPRDPHHPNPETAIKEAVAENDEINITMSVIRYDQVVFPLNIRMSLACVLGWVPLGVEGRKDVCGEKGKGANGSILFSGSSLYGPKKRDSKHFREVANFAARALMGPLSYDMVAMSAVVMHSGADIDLMCHGQPPSCREKLQNENAEHMTDIANVVEEELVKIGFPRNLFSRLILLPSCRLGSDATRSEKGDPCFKSKRYGQYYATFFSYAILAPFFKVSHFITSILFSCSVAWN